MALVHHRKRVHGALSVTASQAFSLVKRSSGEVHHEQRLLGLDDVRTILARRLAERPPCQTEMSMERSKGGSDFQPETARCHNCAPVNEARCGQEVSKRDGAQRSGQ